MNESGSKQPPKTSEMKTKAKKQRLAEGLKRDVSGLIESYAALAACIENSENAAQAMEKVFIFRQFL